MKNKRLIQKLTATALIAGASSFLLTGVVQSTAYGMPGVVPTAYNFIKNVGDLSAYLAIPAPKSYPEKNGDGVSETPRTESSQTEQADTLEYEPPRDTPPVTEEASIEEKPPDSAEESATSISYSDSAEENVTSTTSSDSAEENVTSTPPSDSAEESTVDVDNSVIGKSLLISENISSEKSSTDKYTNRDGICEYRFFGRISGDNAVDLPNGGQLNNCTEMPTSILLQEGTKPPNITIEKNSLPQVLIMHTHTTESYEPFSDGRYDTSYTGRSLSPADSVVGMGAVIAQKLADSGICTVHDGTIHDDPQYSYSYSRSGERVKEILNRYPSIKVVLDIHRDGIEANGIRVAPTTEINGKQAAQIMIICGSDDGTGILPDYMSNLRFATYLQSSIEGQYPTLTRPVLFDYRYYNQDLTTGSLLIELGALGNTKEQAKYTAELLGDALANALLNLAN